MLVASAWLVRVAVTGASMEPTLRDGDRILIRPTAAVRCGDVVVAELPGGRGPGVKRVCGAVAGGWWLLGDNPGASTDSRHFGAVPAETVLGRMVWRYRPLLRASSAARRRNCAR